MIRKICTLLCMVLLCAGAASAQTQLVFQGCTDAHGNNVRAVADPALAVAFETRIEHGAPVIRYNAAVPTTLSDRARTFFYAHECARLGLSREAGSMRSVGDAWRADCRALDTLLGSGLVTRDTIAQLQDELRPGDAEWAALPGPRRDIDLPSCLRGGADRNMRIPAQPSPARDGWNMCVHRCGDALLQCQRRTCNSLDCPACMPANERCVAACGTTER